jgi:choline dehydrogenase-like flavoprotein
LEVGVIARGTTDRVGVFDYVIVGSGAAGASVARTLADTGRSIAILEEGDRVGTNEYSDMALPSLRRLYRDKGFQQTSGGGSLVLQGCCVGGSTVVNSAIVRRLPEGVWASWRTDHGLGDALPLAALERHADGLETELGAAPTPPEIRGGNNALMDRGRAALDIAGGPITRFVRGCRGSARCQLGCPHGAKQSMLLTFIPYAEQRGATVFERTRADRILTIGDRAVGVVAGARRFMARRAVIVAASAIQTPLLLARSGVRSPHLGRHFQAHPGMAVVGFFDDPVRVWSGATQSYEIDAYRHDLHVKIETASLPPELCMALMPGVGRQWVASIAQLEHAAFWAVALRARTEGRVRAGPGGGTRVEFSPGPRDLAFLRAGIRRTAELLFAAGAREVLPGVRGLPARIRPGDVALLDSAPLQPAAYSFVLSHLFGTARMSVRPEDGVVGPDFGVHGRRRLCVVDSSVFPTNLGVNPQLTIMSVARLAAERIAQA